MPEAQGRKLPPEVRSVHPPRQEHRIVIHVNEVRKAKTEQLLFPAIRRFARLLCKVLLLQVTNPYGFSKGFCLLL